MIVLMANTNQSIKQIQFSKKEILVWNDIIYTFRHIRRGKGFDPLDISSELSEDIQSFYYEYPFLFMVGERGDIYPSELGFKLGMKVYTYLRMNRLPDELRIDGYKIVLK